VENQEIIPLSVCAQKYGLESLVEHCQRRLKGTLKQENIVFFFEEIKKKLDGLHEVVIDFLALWHSESFMSRDMEKIDECSLRHVCRRIAEKRRGE